VSQAVPIYGFGASNVGRPVMAYGDISVVIEYARHACTPEKFISDFFIDDSMYIGQLVYAIVRGLGYSRDEL
jgi:hypothetical protein